MPIPDFQSIMLPLLKFLSDGKIRSSREIRDAMAGQFRLTDEERNELLPSGTVARFDNNVSWVLAHLSKAILLMRPERGKYAISERGKQVINEKPERIDLRYLVRFPEYTEWRKVREKTEAQTPEKMAHSTPEELIGDGYQELRDTLAEEILSRVKTCSPRFFEKMVVELLLKMGYGGTLPEAGQVIGKSGDGGIDGVIKEDKLGLDFIYIQAKRWDNVVGRPLVQAFAGSLLGHGAKKGVMISTSHFSPDAREYVKTTGEQKIVLIDGRELAQLMMDYDVGVTTVNTYAVKRIDSDYFEEE